MTNQSLQSMLRRCAAQAITRFNSWSIYACTWILIRPRLVLSFVTSRVNYCNSLLASAPVYQTNQLQRGLNVTARLLFRLPRFDLDRVKIKDRLHLAACSGTHDFQTVHTRIQVAPRLGSMVPGEVVQPGRQQLLSPEPPLSWQEWVTSPETNCQHTGLDHLELPAQLLGIHFHNISGTMNFLMNGFYVD